MRRTTMLLVVSVLLGIVATSTVNAAEVTHYRSRGVSASAGLYSSDGCINTSTSVNVNDMTTKVGGPPTESTILFLSIWQWDECTSTILRNIFATVSLGPNEFVGSKKLDGAALITTVSGYDNVTSSAVEITLDIDWVGDGEISRGQYQSHYWFGGQFSSSRGNGSFRPAVMSGVISDGITDYAAGSIIWGQIGYSTNSSLAIVK